ncbi:MAG: hypothetical protein FJZ47_21525 [Candidatus Tectomicrobia bacterium]|uniref:Uncharacterized protein n=1 Tax=Tectimicrobiota bacterium TaxID=2528274 RepID=A0A937W488_UNCTE|nr:hypothetical protein [Candidatus Tectomicrobia bacterium]
MMTWQCWFSIGMGVTIMVSMGVTERPSVWANKVQSQHDHQHTAPHGGQVVEASKHHLELVVQDHAIIKVYLYNEAMQPVALPTPEATLYLRLPGNKNHTLTLSATGSGTEAAWTVRTEVLQHVSAFEAALRVSLAGETRNVRFTYKKFLP